MRNVLSCAGYTVPCLSSYRASIELIVYDECLTAVYSCSSNSTRFTFRIRKLLIGTQYKINDPPPKTNSPNFVHRYVTCKMEHPTLDIRKYKYTSRTHDHNNSKTTAQTRRSNKHHNNTKILKYKLQPT